MRSLGRAVVTAAVVGGAAAAVPPAAGAAGPVFGGPAGDEGEMAVARMTPSRRAVNRFVFAYVARCSDGLSVVGWTGFTFKRKLRKGRFAVSSDANGLQVTIRGRRTRFGLTGTTKVTLAHQNGSQCTAERSRFVVSRRYAGGTTSQGYPFLLRVSATGRSVSEFYAWVEAPCGGDMVSWLLASGQDIPVDGGRFTQERTVPVQNASGQTVGERKSTVSGQLGRGAADGTVDASSATTNPDGSQRACASGPVTFETWSGARVRTRAASAAGGLGGSAFGPVGSGAVFR